MRGAEKYNAGSGGSDVLVVLACAAQFLGDIKCLEILGEFIISSFSSRRLFCAIVGDFVDNTCLFHKNTAKAMTEKKQGPTRLQTHKL